MDALVPKKRVTLDPMVTDATTSLPGTMHAFSTALEEVDDLRMRRCDPEMQPITATQKTMAAAAAGDTAALPAKKKPALRMLKSAVYTVKAVKTMSKSSSIFEALKNSETMISSNPIKRLAIALYDFNFHPHHTFHTVWDVFMLLLVFYSAIWEPYKAAFVEQGPMTWFEWTVDAFFYADICINFFTGFDRGYDMVMDKKLIAKNYLGGWFWVDFLATVQWDLILSAVLGVQSVLTSLFRLIKVARLARASRLIARLTAAWTINTGFIEAFKFFIYTLLAAHILACLFYMVPTLFKCDKTVLAYGDDFNGAPFAEGDFNGREHCLVNTTCDDTCVPTSWRDGLNEGEEYTYALYWSLTTMTTIGYGDVTPKQEEEIIFVLVAEVLGLGVFALLLTQINNLNEVLGIQQELANDTKNEIVGFMKWNMLHRTNSDLVERVISFLNFKSTSHCGHWFDDDDPRFEPLSSGLRREIKLAMGKPVLKNVKFFGHSEEDDREKQNVKDLFDSMDTDGGGSLDVSEIAKLTSSLGLDLTDEQMAAAVAEMDDDGSGAVGAEEFQEWWFTKKYGKPMFPRCSETFLDELANVMTIQPASPSDVIVERGDYGHGLYIVLTGSVQLTNLRKKSTETPGREFVVRDIANTDREPLFGLSSCLEADTYAVACRQTQNWTATATKFCDLTYISRDQLRAAIDKSWPEGRMQLYKVALYFYSLGGTQPPQPGAAAAELEDNGNDRLLAVESRMGALEAQLSMSMDDINSKLEALIAASS